MTKEMYAANVRNWLMDLATGAKAAQKAMQFANEEKNREWRVTASCYDRLEDGVAIHNLKNLADAIEVPVMFEPFKPGEYLYENTRYLGYNYIELFGVRFYDFAEPEDAE